MVLLLLASVMGAMFNTVHSLRWLLVDAMPGMAEVACFIQLMNLR